MTHRIVDRVQETTTSSGSGSLLLDSGATSRMFTFANSGYQDGDTFPCLIEHETANEVEITKATFHAGTPPYITRADTPVRSTTGAKIDFSPGNKTISVVVSGNDVAGLWQIKAANFSAAARGLYSVDTSDAAVTATLPLSASLDDGDEFGFSDYAGSWGTHNLTIDGNGTQFRDADGILVDRVICDDPARFTVVYVGADDVFMIR